MTLVYIYIVFTTKWVYNWLHLQGKMKGMGQKILFFSSSYHKCSWNLLVCQGGEQSTGKRLPIGTGSAAFAARRYVLALAACTISIGQFEIHKFQWSFRQNISETPILALAFVLEPPPPPFYFAMHLPIGNDDVECPLPSFGPLHPFCSANKMQIEFNSSSRFDAKFVWILMFEEPFWLCG